MRRRNIRWWWRWTDPQDVDVQGDVDAYIRAADRYKVARAAVPPDRHHLIGRIQAAPAGAGGRPPDAAPVPPDVAEAVRCRRAAAEALGRVRRRGYDGSVRLLRDVAAAGYDVEAVVA